MNKHNCRLKKITLNHWGFICCFHRRNIKHNMQNKKPHLVSKYKFSDILSLLSPLLSFTVHMQAHYTVITSVTSAEVRVTKAVIFIVRCTHTILDSEIWCKSVCELSSDIRTRRARPIEISRSAVYGLKNCL